MRIIDDFKEFSSGGGTGKKLATLFFNPNFHSVCLYRLSNLFYKMHLSIISKIIWYINRMLFHVDIDYRADLAGGFVLVHGLGTVIGKSVRSKGRLTVYQGVTIGGNNGKIRLDEAGKSFGQPIIGENVKVYTGAGIYGPVIVQDKTVIKAGSIVTHDI